jgi:hypothetical protein
VRVSRQRRQLILILILVGRGLICRSFVAAGLGIAGSGLVAAMFFGSLRPERDSGKAKTTNRAHGQGHAPEVGVNPENMHVDNDTSSAPASGSPPAA